MKAFFRDTLLSFTLVMWGCSRPLSPGEVKAWLSDPSNGVHVTHVVNGFEFDVLFNPFAGYEQKASKSDSTDIKQIILKIRKLDGKDLLLDGVRTEAEAYQSQYYYSYQFQHDIFIQIGDEKIPCGFYHFEKTMDAAHGCTFHLMFDGKGIRADEFFLVIESTGLSALPIRIKLRNRDFPEVTGL